MSQERKYTILVVDDDPINIDVMAGVLKSRGYRVLQAMNGERAVSIADRALPDLVLLDVQMPGIDGYEVCRRLKEQEKLTEIPVLFVSAQTTADDKVRGFQAGGVDYIIKPFDHEELLARVGTHLALKSAREALKVKNEEIESLLHVLAHDLMNPISATCGFIRLAERIPAYHDRKNRMYWEMVSGTVRQMEDIIEHVRQFRSLDSGKAQVELSAVKLDDVFSTAGALFKNRMEEKEIHLDTSIDGAGGLFVLAEPVSLTHNVINNLLSNAIKFSHRRSVISMRAKSEGSRAHIWIQDHGIGIPGVLLDRIFRPDKPTTRPGTENECGTGFGMPLVKKYVDYFGGTILIESNDIDDSADDHGTTVHIYLKIFQPGGEENRT